MLVTVVLSITASRIPCGAANDYAAAPGTLTDGEAGVLLLQDGGVLTGTISQTADWYVVAHAGGQMQVASSRVQFVGKTLSEAYQFRCQHLSANTVEAHLVLADWCLRHNLLEEAGKELTTARSLGPDHPRLALLDRRLTAAKEAATQPAHVAASKNNPPAPVASGATTAARPDVSNNVVEVFTRKVQPVLVNNCTVAKCHEPGGAQAFQLNRAVLRGEANRRTTMQNLAATLALIDHEHPDASQLLTVPRQAHGGMSAAILGTRQEAAFKHLADWVALVAPTSPADDEQTPTDSQIAAPLPMDPHAQKSEVAAAKRARAMPGQSKLQTVGVDLSGGRDASGAIVDPDVEPATALDDSQPKTLRPAHRLKVGVTAKKWEPRDAFDPEIFNRQIRQPAQLPPAEAAKPIKPASAVEN